MPCCMSDTASRGDVRVATVLWLVQAQADARAASAKAAEQLADAQAAGTALRAELRGVTERAEQLEQQLQAKSSKCTQLEIQQASSTQAAEAADASMRSLQEQHADAQDRLAQFEAAAAASAEELGVLKVG